MEVRPLGECPGRGRQSQTWASTGVHLGRRCHGCERGGCAVIRNEHERRFISIGGHRLGLTEKPAAMLTMTR